MLVLRTRLPTLIGAGAITCWPIMLVRPEQAEHPATLMHEGVHAEQQKPWVVLGLLAVVVALGGFYLGAGELNNWCWLAAPFPFLWHILYLLCLPFGWNPWRRKWETEAYRAEGMSQYEIDYRLERAPYWLWVPTDRH